MSKNYEFELDGAASLPATASADRALIDVASYLESIPNFGIRVGNLIRQAIDEVIDGARSGRWSIRQLEKTEATSIGTKIEILFRDEFALVKGKKLDFQIVGHEVDLKWTKERTWPIPAEAVNELCLLLRASEGKATFDLGLLRATSDCFTKSEKGNRDGKRSVSAKARDTRMYPFFRGEPYPRNVFDELDQISLQEVFDHRGGEPRIVAFFSRFTELVVSRTVIEALGKQKDSANRARKSRPALRKVGIELLCGTWKVSREVAEELGRPIRKDEWVAIPIGSLTPAQLRKLGRSKP